MPKKEKEEEGSVFFVGVRDPIEIRRSLLESSKEILQYMQRSEKFKEVRKEKAVQIGKLRDIMKELNKLVKSLKVGLPKTGLRAKKAKVEAPKKKKASKKKAKKTVLTELPEVKVEKPQEMSEIERLEAELGEIEGRLSKLV